MNLPASLRSDQVAALHWIRRPEWRGLGGRNHWNAHKHVMEQFFDWIVENSEGKRARFISDNNGFDWMFVCWYFWHFLEKNPFGHSSTNLGSLYKGMVGTMFDNFKHLRITPHTHNPVEDARGNAEALLHMIKEMGLKFDLKS